MTASPTVDWKVPAGAALIVLIVIAGIVVAVRSIEPRRGWLDLTSLRVTSDEAYLYMLVETSGSGDPDWQSNAYRIAIDTYDSERGSRTLPSPLEATTGSGVEFLIEILGPGQSALLVVEGYDPFEGEESIYSPKDSTGRFRPLRVQTNRERFARDGEFFPAVTVDRGSLHIVDSHTANPGGRSDVVAADGRIEIRLPWALLNVTDPSSRTVLHSLERGRDRIGTQRTEGFRIYAYSFSLEAESDPRLADQIPSGRGAAPLYRWETWDRPTFELKPKAGLHMVKEAMESIADPVAEASGYIP